MFSRATLFLDMKSATKSRDGTLDITPDKSRYGRTVTLGDGAGVGKPSFSNPSFTCASQRIQLARDAFGGTEFTWILGVRPAFKLATGTNRYLMSGDVTDIRLLLNTTNNLLVVYGGSLSITVTYATLVPVWKEYGLNVIVAAIKNGDSVVYVNNQSVATSASAVTTLTPTNIWLGEATSAAFPADGTYSFFAALPFKVTPTQEREVYNYVTAGQYR